MDRGGCCGNLLRMTGVSSAFVLSLSTAAAHAQPAAVASGASPGNQLINEPFTAQVCFDNGGSSTGFQPVFEFFACVLQCGERFGIGLPVIALTGLQQSVDHTRR